MQLRQPSPDALVSFSDFLLERFGLVATMQVAIVASITMHIVAIVGLGFKLPSIPKWDAPHNVMDVVLVNARSQTKPEKADALAQANLDGGGNTDQKLRARSPFPTVEDKDPSRELTAGTSAASPSESCCPMKMRSTPMSNTPCSIRRRWSWPLPPSSFCRTSTA